MAKKETEAPPTRSVPTRSLADAAFNIVSVQAGTFEPGVAIIDTKDLGKVQIVEQFSTAFEAWVFIRGKEGLRVLDSKGADITESVIPSEVLNKDKPGTPLSAEENEKINEEG